MSAHERERLSAYLDRELPPGERAVVEAHLAACPECAAFLAELAAVDEAAASLPAEAPEGYFETFPARVRARLQVPKSAFPARRVPAWTWAAAAALLLAVVAPLTLRQLRTAPGMAPSAVPPALSPAPVPAAVEPEVAEKPRQPQSPPTAHPARAVSSEKRGPVLAAAPAAAPATVSPGAEAPLAKDEVMAEGIFAREPAAPPTAGGVAREAARDRLRPAAAPATAESTSPALSAATAGAALEAPPAPEHEDAFRRLESVHPRSAAEWRRLRNEWNAFAATETDSVRADEARVRAIAAAREAWRTGGEEDDESAFRRAVAAYLQREDARQKPRVERLLAETRRTP